MTARQLRDVTDADLDALADLFRRASLSNPGSRDVLRAHPEVLELDREALRAGRTRVLWQGEQIAGYARTVVDGEAAELEDLFVDPDRHRQGLGRVLVDDAVAIARAARADRLEVTGNPDALEFYRAVGFAETGPIDTPLGLPAVRLSRPLRIVPISPP